MKKFNDLCDSCHRSLCVRSERLCNECAYDADEGPSREDMFAHELKNEIQSLMRVVDYELSNKKNVTQPTRSFIEGEKAVLEVLNSKVKEFFNEDGDIKF